MKKTFLGIITIMMVLAVILSTTVNAASLTADKGKVENTKKVTLTIKTESPVASMEFDLKFDTTKYKFVEGSIKTDLSMVDSNLIGDTLTVSAMDTSKTASVLTLEFEALEEGEAEPFVISNTEFSKDGEEVKDAFTSASSVAVPVIKLEDKKPEEDNKPAEDNKQEENNKPTEDNKQEENNKPAEDNKQEENNKPVEDNKQEENNKPAEDNKQEENNKPEEDNKQEENNKPTEDKTDKNEGKYFDEDGKEITKIPQTGIYVPAVIFAIAIFGTVVVVGYKLIKNK